MTRRRKNEKGRSDDTTLTAPHPPQPTLVYHRLYRKATCPLSSTIDFGEGSAAHVHCCQRLLIGVFPTPAQLILPKPNMLTGKSIFFPFKPRQLVIKGYVHTHTRTHFATSQQPGENQSGTQMQYRPNDTRRRATYPTLHSTFVLYTFT